MLTNDILTLPASDNRMQLVLVYMAYKHNRIDSFLYALVPRIGGNLALTILDCDAPEMRVAQLSCIAETYSDGLIVVVD
jgi:hypothetical protein